MNSHRLIVLAFFAMPSLALSLPSHARDGEFVRSFGTDGREQIRFSPDLNVTLGNGFGFIRIVRQPADGKILVNATVVNGPNYDFGVVRLDADGTPDSSFGAARGQQIVSFDDGGNNDDVASAVALDAQGNVLLAGTADGSGNGGSSCAIARLTPSGLLDSGFSADGKTNIDFDLGPMGQRNDTCHDMALQSDGKILLVGSAQTGQTADANPVPTSRLAIARLMSYGVRDTSFNGSGLVSIDLGPGIVSANALAVVEQSDGGIVLVGGATSTTGSLQMVLARLTSTGALDTNFGNGGTLLFDPAISGYSNGELTDVVSLPDDSIVVSGAIGASNGQNFDFYFARFSATGSLDSSFGFLGQKVVPFDLGGFQLDLASAMSLDQQGRYVANGVAMLSNSTYAMAVVRLTPAGELDDSFGTLGSLLASTAPDGGSSSDQGLGLALTPDGSILTSSLAELDSPYEARVGIAKLVGDTIFSNGFQEF